MTSAFILVDRHAETRRSTSTGLSTIPRAIGLQIEGPNGVETIGIFFFKKGLAGRTRRILLDFVHLETSKTQRLLFTFSLFCPTRIIRHTHRKHNTLY